MSPTPHPTFIQTPSYHDIMYPAWSFWSGGPSISVEPTGLGRWDLKRRSLLAASEEWSWERKRDLGFFRGSRFVFDHGDHACVSCDHASVFVCHVTVM